MTTNDSPRPAPIPARWLTYVERDALSTLLRRKVRADGSGSMIHFTDGDLAVAVLTREAWLTLDPDSDRYDLMIRVATAFSHDEAGRVAAHLAEQADLMGRFLRDECDVADARSMIGLAFWDGLGVEVTPERPG